VEGLIVSEECFKRFFVSDCDFWKLLPQGDILIADSLGVLSCFSGKNLYAIGKEKPSTCKVFLRGDGWKSFCVVPLPKRFDAVLVFSEHPEEDFEPSVRFAVNHVKERGLFLVRVNEKILPFAVSFLSEFSRIELLFSSLVLARLLEFPF